MRKRLKAVVAAVMATVLSACTIGAAGRGASALEEWGRTQTQFPGAEVKRDQWKMGTTGATVHYAVAGVADAREFASGLRAEIERINPRSGEFVGRVTWPVDGGVVSYQFPGHGELDDKLWAVADAPLPVGAVERRLGWMESKRLRGTPDGAPLMEYVSDDLLATAEAADAPEGFQVVVRSTVGEASSEEPMWLGPFPAAELVERARLLRGVEMRRVGGDHVAMKEARDVRAAADHLGSHAWTVSGDAVSAEVGPGTAPELDLLDWVAAQGKPFSFYQAGRVLRLTASGEDECQRLLAEAPPPSRSVTLRCHAHSAYGILDGTFTELSTFMAPSMKALRAGAGHVSMKPGEVGASLDHERPETWIPALAAIRELNWDGEWRVGLQGYVASRLMFSSTATGPAEDVQQPRRTNETHEADIERLLAAWNASAG